MQTFGKNIKLFLLDGTPTGRWICELSNWTGIAYKIPRSMIKACEERPELSSSGVYFLFGEDDKENKPLVYIGEAENIMTRLKQHLDSKDYWNEVIVFISKDDNLNKAHIKYLENRFYELAIAARRYALITDEYDNQVCSTGFCVLRADVRKVLPKWIFYNITTKKFYEFIEKYQKGASYPAVSDKEVKAYKIPIIDIKEQQRIVDILDRFDALCNDMTIGLPAEIAARQKQYEYYRDKLLTFKEKQV